MPSIGPAARLKLTSPGFVPFAPVATNLPQGMHIVQVKNRGEGLLQATVIAMDSQLLSEPPPGVHDYIAWGVGEATLFFQFGADPANGLTFTAAAGQLGATPPPTQVSGNLTVAGQPAARKVMAFSQLALEHVIDGVTVTQSRSLGEAVSDAATGDWSITLLSGFTGQTFVVAFDDFGQPYADGLALEIGDRVRPTVDNGFVYEAQSAGTITGPEPDPWPVQEGDVFTAGGVSVKTVAFQPPAAQGYFTPLAV